ncbi:hypothetical protein MHYP_G00340920 [Metynnis hypsauchen]
MILMLEQLFNEQQAKTSTYATQNSQWRSASATGFTLPANAPQSSMEKNGVTLNSKEEETPTRTKAKEKCGEDWWSPARPCQGRTGELESCRNELVCSGGAQLELYKEEPVVLSVRKLLMDRRRQEGEQISVLSVELCTMV